MVATHRTLGDHILKFIGQNKVLLLFGTRRVGKTILTQQIESKVKGEIIWMHGEDQDVHDQLQKRSIANYQKLFGNARLLIIDEAQAIPEIGQILKVIIDHNPDLTILATGSSSFDLLNKSGEPLTGRQHVFYLYPFTEKELHKNPVISKQNLDERLIFGSYPEVVKLKTFDEKAHYLQSLIQSYLLRDILSFDGIKNSDKILKLLRLVAYQTGNEVSYTELGQQLGMSKNTIEHYLDLLSKVFIIYKLPSYSTNLRKEISKGSKWYFYDNGIRNAIINDFRLLNLRQDVGSLWESYALSERIKKNSNQSKTVHYYFWRTYDQQEVDFIEIENGEMRAFEFKYTEPKRIKVPVFYASSYPQSSFEVIHQNNYLDWIL